MKCLYCGSEQTHKGVCRTCGAPASGQIRMATPIRPGVPMESGRKDHDVLKAFTFSILVVGAISGFGHYQAKKDTARVMAPIRDREQRVLRGNIRDLDGFLAKLDVRRNEVSQKADLPIRKKAEAIAQIDEAKAGALTLRSTFQKLLVDAS